LLISGGRIAVRCRVRCDGSRDVRSGADVRVGGDWPVGMLTSEEDVEGHGTQVSHGTTSRGPIATHDQPRVGSRCFYKRHTFLQAPRGPGQPTTCGRPGDRIQRWSVAWFSRGDRGRRLGHVGTLQTCTEITRDVNLRVTSREDLDAGGCGARGGLVPSPDLPDLDALSSKNRHHAMVKRRGCCSTRGHVFPGVP
jgi:hypothetical protein